MSAGRSFQRMCGVALVMRRPTLASVEQYLGQQCECELTGGRTSCYVCMYVYVRDGFEPAGSCGRRRESDAADEHD